MGKIILPYCIILLLWFPIYSGAQSFELSATEIHVKGKIGERIEIPISIKNLTDQPLSIVIERTENNISNGQASFICWDKDCSENTSLHKRIDSKKSANHIVATLEAGLAGGYSHVKYLIFNRNSPNDAMELSIHYTIEEPFLNEEIYTSSAIRIKEVYPNPVSDYIYINYAINNPQTSAKVGIHNVLGSLVNEFQLESMENKAKISTSDLNSGVYFYSLSVNNETVLIKKFVVRK